VLLDLLELTRKPPDTPSYVIYHELILTSKEYMTQVTAIDPYWLGKPPLHGNGDLDADTVL
jgi:hypothetical protein